MKKLLENVGFQIETAENGLEGVEIFKRWAPHFIWMDRRMPVMDGMEATRRIRMLEGGRSVKIVALTASVFKEQQQEILDAGMDDLVRKPYRPDEIFACMKKHLGVRYIYQGSVPEAERPIEELRPEDFADLPEALHVALKDALISLYEEPIAEAVEQIGHWNADLGRRLKHHIDNLDYARIFQVLEDDNSN